MIWIGKQVGIPHMSFLVEGLPSDSVNTVWYFQLIKIASTVSGR